MKKIRLFTLIAFAVGVMFSLASVPASAEGFDVQKPEQLPAVEYAADVSVLTTGDKKPGLDHLRSGSPGAENAIAGGSSNEKVTDNAKETPFGGAVGLSSQGMRGESKTS